MGSIYRRTFKHCATCKKQLRRKPEIVACEAAGHRVTDRQSPTWYIAYETPDGWRNESSRSHHKVDAQRLLLRREGAAQRKELPARGFTFDDAADAAIAEYKMHGRRSLNVFQRRITKHLKPVFTGRELGEITTPAIREFITARQAAKASNAEINRELDCLSKMFRLAIQDGRLFVRPHIPKLKESAPRKGFVTPEEYAAIAQHLQPHIRPIWTFLYLTGWRVTEALALKWEHVGEQEIRFTEPTKADEPARTIPITTPLRALLLDQKQQIGDVQTDYVFTFFARTPKGHLRKKRAGTAISYGGWLNAFRDARTAAKVRPTLLGHDCRRTAIDRMERLGIAQSTAMSMAGHKTPSVYRRYAIVSTATLHDAGKRLDAEPPPPVDR